MPGQPAELDELVDVADPHHGPAGLEVLVDVGLLTEARGEDHDGVRVGELPEPLAAPGPPTR